MDPISIIIKLSQLARQVQVEASNDDARVDNNPTNSDQLRDEFSKPAQEEKIAAQAAAQRQAAGDVSETLGVGFGDDDEPVAETTTATDISDTDAGGGRDQYIAQLEEAFAKAIDSVQEGDLEGFKKILDDTQARILDDMEKGNIKNGVLNFGKKDMEDAAKLMQDAQKQILDRLKEQAANAGGGGSVDNSAADKAFYDALVRQSRIDKWESLKDQEYVNYLKATLSGIKASEKLAASAK
jgi:hypothetical protein